MNYENTYLSQIRLYRYSGYHKSKVSNSSNIFFQSNSEESNFLHDEEEQNSKSSTLKERRKRETKEEKFQRFIQEQLNQPSFSGVKNSLELELSALRNQELSKKENNSYAERIALAELSSDGSVRWAPDPQNPHSHLEGDTCFVNGTRVPPHLEHWILDPFGDKRPRDRKLAKREKILARLEMKRLARQRKRLLHRADLNNIENIMTGEETLTPPGEIKTQTSELASFPDVTNSTTVVSSDTDDVISHRLPLLTSVFKHTSVRQLRVAHLIEQTLQNILTHHKFLSGPPSLALAQAKSQDKHSVQYSPIWSLLQIRKPRPPERPSLQETLGTSHYLLGSVFQRAHVQITRVEVTRDLHFAKVWWKCLPGHEEAVQREFDLLGVQLRTLLTIRIQLKHSPQLIFIHDAPKQIQIELNTRLDQIEAELRKNPSNDSTNISSLLRRRLKHFPEDK